MSYTAKYSTGVRYVAPVIKPSEGSITRWHTDETEKDNPEITMKGM